MSETFRPRRVLAVLAALVLPAATCGVAPALRDLIQRTQRLERFVANAELPRVLVDDRDIVVGTVLEYNDVMLYSSVPYYRYATERPSISALATVLFEVPGLPPIPLEANRDALLTPIRGPAEWYYFESSDCSGTAWIRKPVPASQPLRDDAGPSVFGFGRIREPGQTLYTADLAAAGEFIWTRSRLLITRYSTHYTAEWPVCEPRERPGGFNDMLPLRPTFDLSAFAPPFRIADQRDLWLDPQ